MPKNTSASIKEGTVLLCLLPMQGLPTLYEYSTSGAGLSKKSQFLQMFPSEPAHIK